ncbi:MAG: glycosyltransferase family 2 protein [Candidatus Zixiibacteriota bacterium]
MDLSIIIVNYKSRDWLDKCLQSITRDEPPEEPEIIVVDNDSWDGSVSMLKEKHPEVVLVENQENVGFAKACNQGAEIATGRYFFFLNPDSEITYGTHDRILRFMDSHAEVGVGGCGLYYPDGKAQVSAYKFTSLSNLVGRALLLYSFLPRNRLTAPFFRDYLRPGEPTEGVCGGAMVVRREAFEGVGSFDESLFLYYEDEDLCYRMKQRGWETATIPETRIIHHYDQSSKKNIRMAIFSCHRSHFLFYSKFRPLLKVVLFRAIQFLGFSIRSLFWLLKLAGGQKKESTKQRFLGYLSLLLSDFRYRRTLIG